MALARPCRPMPTHRLRTAVARILSAPHRTPRALEFPDAQRNETLTGVGGPSAILCKRQSGRVSVLPSRYIESLAADSDGCLGTMSSTRYLCIAPVLSAALRLRRRSRTPPTIADQLGTEYHSCFTSKNRFKRHRASDRGEYWPACSCMDRA